MDASNLSADDFEKKYQELLTYKFETANEKEEFQIIYHYFKLANGWDSDGLSQIDDIAQKNESIRGRAHFFKGIYFSRVKNHEAAKNEFLAAIDSKIDDDAKANYVNCYCEEMLNITSAKELLPFVNKYLAENQSPKGKAKLILTQAFLYTKMNDNITATACRMKALALSAAVESERFDTAYNTPDSLKPLAALNYNIIALQGEKNLSALNNLGVICSIKNMPIRGFKLYSKASKQGETLANANIAYNYLKIGDIDSAQEILQQAKEAKEIHENVYSAEAEIIKSQKQEKESWEKLLCAGDNIQKFLLEYYNRCFSESTNDLLSGPWISPYGTEILLSPKNNKCSLTWGENRYSLSKLEINIIGLAFTGHYEEYKYPELITSMKGDFIGFLGENKLIFLMLNEDYKILEFHKKESSL